MTAPDRRTRPASSPPHPLPAHSLAEAFLYVMVRRCAHCGTGPLHPGRLEHPSDDSRDRLTLHVRCEACRQEETLCFSLPAADRPEPADTAQRVPGRPVNPTDRPSRIIDVPQWVTLHEILMEASRAAASRTEARELAWDAAQCLDEALKFYDADSELPPPEACFSDESRLRVREHPELYLRSVLLRRRQQLPASPPRQPARTPRRWWPFRRHKPHA